MFLRLGYSKSLSRQSYSYVNPWLFLMPFSLNKVSRTVVPRWAYLAKTVIAKTPIGIIKFELEVAVFWIIKQTVCYNIQRYYVVGTIHVRLHQPVLYLKE
jgi:hypothetical protein